MAFTLHLRGYSLVLFLGLLGILLGVETSVPLKGLK